MPTTGITKCAMARQLTDTEDGMTFEKPEYFPNVQELDIKPKVNTDKAYAENRLIDQASLFDSADVTADFYDFTPQQRSKYLGQTLEEDGGSTSSMGDNAPFTAILYKAPLTGNKGNRYGVIYKGQWTVPDDSMKGLQGKPDLGQVPKLTGTWQPTNYCYNVLNPFTNIMEEKHPWEHHIDTTENLDDAWFGSVYIPHADNSPLTATTAPADAATGVAASSDIVFTFNKKLLATSVNSNSIFLMKEDGTAVAATVSLDDTGKIVTLHPAASLATGSYIAMATKDVISTTGVALASNIAVNFTV